MRFVSKYRNLRLVKKPQDRIIDDQRRVTVVRGECAEFNNNQYYTDNVEMITWLRNHPEFNNSFGAVEDIDSFLSEQNNSAVKMVTGGNSTVNINRGSSPVEESPKIVEPSNASEEVVTSPVDIKSIIRQELAFAMKDLMAEIATMEKKDSKPKKVFTCKVCGEVFRSGVEVGRHKKEKHNPGVGDSELLNT